MSNISTLSEHPEAAAEPAEQGPWWRRRPFVVAAVVVVILVATVLTDLPQQATPHVQYGTDFQVMRLVNTDVAGCSYAVGEAFMIHRRQLANTLSAGDKAQVPKLLTDDQMACSFTSQSIFDLSNVEVPGSASGRYLQSMVGTVTTWATSDSLGAIEKVQRLWGHPNDAKALSALRRYERLMSADRAAVYKDWRAASQIVRQQLPKPRLKAVPA